MRILYDGAIYSYQSAGGISRYFHNLISRLPRDYQPILSVARDELPGHPEHAALELHCRGFRWWPKPLARLNARAEQRHFLRVQERSSADVFHPTYYSLLSRKHPDRNRTPSILTVYDMIHERFPERLDPRGSHARLKGDAIRNARTIICISEHTKRDLLEFHPQAEPKVRVIHLAADMTSVEPLAPANQPQGPYFIYVGSRASYKNFDRLVDALANVAQRVTDLKLCVVGSPFNATEQEKIGSLGLTDRIVNMGQIDDAALRALYRDSVALVYPSLYEGFGIPPLEAMECGTAVIAANATSIPEVVGDAAIVFDPNSVDALTDSMQHLVESPQSRLDWIEKGHARVRQFSWTRVADEHIASYEMAAKAA